MKTHYVSLSMVHRSTLQEHPGEWDTTDRPEWREGDTLIFDCHGDVVCVGIVTGLRAPLEAGTPDWTGVKRDAWWRTTYQVPALPEGT